MFLKKKIKIIIRITINELNQQKKTDIRSNSIIKSSSNIHVYSIIIIFILILSNFLAKLFFIISIHSFVKEFFLIRSYFEFCKFITIKNHDLNQIYLRKNILLRAHFHVEHLALTIITTTVLIE